MRTFAWETLEDQRFRRVAEYWDQIRGDRLVPLRTDFKFTDHPDLADKCDILDHSKRGNLRYTFAGTEAVLQANKDVTGHNVLERIPTPLSGAIDTWIGQVLSFPCAYISYLSAELPDGRTGNHESLNLPLSSPDGVPRYLLAVTRSGREAMGPSLDEFFAHVSRLKFQPVDIGAGCLEPVDVTAETDFK